MRHGDKINNLSRTASHRKALLSNLAIEFINHKRIVTTLAKAKALRAYIEPLMTKEKKTQLTSVELCSAICRIKLQLLNYSETLLRKSVVVQVVIQELSNSAHVVVIMLKLHSSN